MNQRLQILLDYKEYSIVKSVAAGQGRSVSDWVRSLIRGALKRVPGREQGLLVEQMRGLALPAPEIEEMLREIEAGRT